ncbi:MAG TPA: SRPBCC family protein [Actinomycetes bacterium]|nr:SRPBCC family protein [Actinomycetes bacterium]
MSARAMGLCAAAVLGLATAASVGYLAVGRKPCLTWGASDEDVRRSMPGDDLMPQPDLVATRAIRIAAPASDVYPWLVQMGSGKGGVYTYDWIENLFGLNMHSVDEILPQFQDRQVGDVEQLGKTGPRLRIEVLRPDEAMVMASEDGNWVWAFGLYAADDGSTTLVSRNRIKTPGASPLARAFSTLVMEPGSLVMERKMLLGIRQRAERLARERSPREGASVTLPAGPAPTP